MRARAKGLLVRSNPHSVRPRLKSLLRRAWARFAPRTFDGAGQGLVEPEQVANNQEVKQRNRQLRNGGGRKDAVGPRELPRREGRIR